KQWKCARRFLAEKWQPAITTENGGLLPERRPMTDSSESLAGALAQQIRARIEAAGGWLGFDAFMALALYSPGLGYYANERPKFGSMPASGSDFVTAPEISPAFGRLLAAQVSE